MARIIKRIFPAIPYDKKLHFLVCFALTLVLAWYQPWAGIALAAGTGLGKEYGDSRAIGNTWDWNDILADVLGILAALIVALPFYFIYFR